MPNLRVGTENDTPIEIQVAGSIKGNVRAHGEFAAEMARLLGLEREMITLHDSIV